MKRFAWILISIIVLSWDIYPTHKSCSEITDPYTGDRSENCQQVPDSRQRCFNSLKDMSDFIKKAPLDRVRNWQHRALPKEKGYSCFPDGSLLNCLEPGGECVQVMVGM